MDHEKHEKHERVLYADEAYEIQGAVFEVSREMGIGFLEAVYQECLAIEFSGRESVRVFRVFRGSIPSQSLAWVPAFAGMSGG